MKTRTGRSCAIVSLAAVICLLAGRSGAQTKAPAVADGLLSLIPEEAFFYLERRGHTAIRKAFLSSNLGEMASDEVIKEFVHASRVRTGQMIVKGMFDLEEKEEIDRHQKLLHELLKPFWYRPAAMYAVTGKDFSDTPGFGFLCATGRYRPECKKAIEALMRIGLPKSGDAGTRQEFTYRKHTTVWKGVAKGSGQFKLPKDPKKQLGALKGKSLFMVSWVNDILLIATDLRAADAVSRLLSVAKPPKSKAANKSFQFVMKKTALKDWAFRWYIDVDIVLRAVKGQGRGKAQMKLLTRLGFDGVRGIGGTGGYADKKYARMTYIHAPKVTRGPLRFLKKGGSYKKAISMVPDTTTFCLAGQFDKKAVLETLPVMLGINPRGGAATKPADAPSEEQAKFLKAIQLLAEATNGNAGFFMTDVQGFLGMMAGGGPPIGAVLDLKDREKAVKAIDALIELAGVPGPEDDDERRPGPRVYRKNPIRHLGPMVRLAILKDRAVIALSEDALKVTIDAALDKTGGIPPKSKTEELAKLTGRGAAFFRMDLAPLAKTFWPMIMQAASQESGFFQVPLASLPSAAKLTRMLGPEIAVLEPDAEGLLMKSRGKIPFATKMVLYPMLGMLVYASLR